jgi:hypothetical protein
VIASGRPAAAAAAAVPDGPCVDVRLVAVPIGQHLCGSPLLNLEVVAEVAQ